MKSYMIILISALYLEILKLSSFREILKLELLKVHIRQMWKLELLNVYIRQMLKLELLNIHITEQSVWVSYLVICVGKLLE